jgi:hypothetical protein
VKRVIIGSNPNASALKNEIKKLLSELGHACEDFGSDDPVYANVAIHVAEAVAAGKAERGILLCAAPASGYRSPPTRSEAPTRRFARTPIPPSARSRATMPTS